MAAPRSEVVRLGTQIAIAAGLILALGAGGFFYHQSRPDGEAEAAVGREPDAVPVKIAAVEAGTLRERIEAVGSTLARQAVDIVPLTSGRIAVIAFSPGDRVEAGEVLVRLDDEAERAAVAEAEASLREAELALERAKKLRANNTVAQATVDELQAAYLGASARVDGARKRLADRTVKAPFTGVVGMRRVDVGARVDDDTVLATFDDLSEVEIEFSVPEIFFGRVRLGQPAAAMSTAFPGRTFSGRIATIDTRIGQISRAFRVRAVLPNPDLVLPAGMFMHIEVVLEERPALLIPEEAVVAEGDQTFVFTLQGARAERRPVTLGQRQAGTVEVVEGLKPGDPVVREGVQRLRDGSAVRVLDQPAGAAPRQPQGQSA
jgi:membrane fusion protein (multidrug efflux system)